MTRQSAASIANHAPCSVFIGLVLAAAFFLLSGPRSAAAQTREGQDPPKNATPPAQDDFEKEMATARSFIQRGNFAEAAKSFSRAAEVKKGDCSDCYRMVSQCYLQMARFTEAAEAARKAIALKPTDEADIQNLLGVELYLLGDDSHLTEATVAFKRSLELTKGKLPEVYFNLGYTLIKLGKIAEGTDALKDYLKVAPDGANAYEARAVIANPKLAGERIARNFKVTTIDGKDLSLEALKGKIVLLEFWATWCGPCRVEMPEVRRIWEKYRTERFVLVGISLDDDREALDHYIAQMRITWPQYYEGDGKVSVSGMYGVHAIPENFLIDQDGVIRAVSLRGPELEAKLTELLKKLPAAQAGK